MDAPEPVLPGGISGPALLTPAQIERACLALRARSDALRALPNAPLIDALADLSARWLDPRYPFRAEAEARLEASTGFSLSVLRWGLDALFSAWDRPAMYRLLEDDLGDPAALERFVRAPGRAGRMAVGPRLAVHVLAGNVPPPTLQSLFAAILARAPSFLKASTREPWFPTLLVRSIEDGIPVLRGAVACAAWPGGDPELEAALFAHAEVVVAYGSNETLASIQARVRPPARVVARGHRLSVAYVAREALTRARVRSLAEAIARDVAVFDQSGCLSPHAVLVERGGEVSPEAFARVLADQAFPAVEAALPPGRMELDRAAAIMQFKGVHAFTGEVLEGPGYAVVLTAGLFEPSCLGRVLLVHPVGGPEDATAWLEPVAPLLQAMALEALEPRRTGLARAFALFGAGRICAPAGWGGDGRPMVGDLVRWVTLEPAAS
jgi:hypothetical protein